MPEGQASLINNRLLVTNVFWNLLGMGIPLLVAIFTIPLLIDGLGISRYGILTIVWMIIGYFNLFDLGIGTVLTPC
jgi:O-antigen/teichoic acid export membrane protein